MPASAAARWGRLFAKMRTPRAGTKQAKLIEMLRTEGGATTAQVAAATGWQSHRVRGAISGALKKRLRLDVTSDKLDGRVRVNRIIQAVAGAELRIARGETKTTEEPT